MGQRLVQSAQDVAQEAAIKRQLETVQGKDVSNTQ